MARTTHKFDLDATTHKCSHDATREDCICLYVYTLFTYNYH